MKIINEFKKAKKQQQTTNNKKQKTKTLTDNFDVRIPLQNFTCIASPGAAVQIFPHLLHGKKPCFSFFATFFATLFDIVSSKRQCLHCDKQVFSQCLVQKCVARSSAEDTLRWHHSHDKLSSLPPSLPPSLLWLNRFKGGDLACSPSALSLQSSPPFRFVFFVFFFDFGEPTNRVLVHEGGNVGVPVTADVGHHVPIFVLLEAILICYVISRTVECMKSWSTK